MSDLTKRYGVLPSAVLMCVAGGCATFEQDYIDYTTDKVEYIDVEPEIGAALLESGDRIRPSLYAAAGLGVSYLTPDTSGANGISVDEPAVAGGQVTVGLDVNKHLAVEMHSADLGSAGLNPAGRINYHLNGASALYYAGNARGNKGRRGLTAFGRLGVGAMDNSPVGPVNYRRSHDVQAIFGGGVEYNTRSGLGLRAEVMSFDTDAQYAQLGMTYRLGQRKRQNMEVLEVIETVEAEPSPRLVVPAPTPAPELTPEPIVAQPLPEPAPQPELVLASATVPKDSDRDGVLDRHDECPDTAVRSTVDRDGCAIFSGTIEGVNFKTASAELTDEAVDMLDDISGTLRDYPRTHLTIKAHTDSDGDAFANQQLSERRARVVVDFLARRGFPYSRMTAKAYGERSPLDSNQTAEGRATNRRVEIFASNPK